MGRDESSGAAKGRSPPPADAQFRKGSLGQPAGRPKGSVSLDGLTREFALKKQVVKIGGKRQKLSRLEIAIFKLTALAASGKPAAARLTHELRALGASKEPEHRSGVLLAPAQTTPRGFFRQNKSSTNTASNRARRLTSNMKNSSRLSEVSPPHWVRLY